MILRPRRLVMWSCVVWVVTMAGLVFSGSIWASYERQAMMYAKRTSFSPEPHIKQSSHTSEPVKPGASYERESSGMEPADNTPSYPGSPLSRIVRSDPARNTPLFHSGVLLRDEPGSLSGGELRTGAPGSYAGWASDSGRRSSIPHPLVHLRSSVVGTSETQSMKSQSRLSDAGSTPAASTIRGGVPVSTGDVGAMETAGKDSRKTDQNNTRQLLVAAGGLNSSLRDAGSLGHRNQPYLRRGAVAGAMPPALANLEREGASKRVTDRRDGHLQTFRGGAAWSRSGINRPTKPNVAGTYQSTGGEDTQPRGPARGLTARHLTVGIKPDRHLEAFVWHPHYLAAQHLCDVPVRLIAEVVRAESAGNPWALSSAGARGLMQVKPSTAAELGDFDLWNPAQNLIVGSCYLRRQFDRFGTWRKALHAYHGGPNRLRTSQASRDYADDIMGSAQ